MNTTNMNRQDWEFEYTASKLADAALAQRDYRLKRVEVWTGKKEETIAKIRQSGLEVHESVADKMSNYTVSANSAQIVVDITLQRDLNECVSKIHENRALAKSYDAWLQVLEANPEVRLKLKHADWMYFFGK